MSNSSSPPESLMPLLSLNDDFIKPNFVENVGTKYNCVKCLDFLRAPVKQLPCGHRICENCVTEVRQAGIYTKCPGDEEECDKTDLMNTAHVFPDYGVVREMKSTKIYCCNKDFGCEEIITWGRIKAHFEGCRFKPQDCPNREIGCPKKGTSAEMHEHSQACEYEPLLCKFCSTKVPKKEMQAGHETQCAARPKNCDFKKVGCTFTALKKEELLEHLQRDHYEHVKVLVDAFHKMQSENTKLKNRLDEQENKIKGLEKELRESMKKTGEFTKNYSDKMRNVMKATATNSNKVAGLEEKHQNLLRQVANVHESRIKALEMGGSQSQSITEEFQRQLVNLDRTMSTFNLRLAENEIRNQCLETASYNGVLMWKIKDYQHRKSEAIQGKILSLYSQPFYTSRFGYKMCCRVYLNGDGMGKGKNLSIFFVVMKGDFDDLLQWPFRQKVTLTLLDLEHGRRHLSDTFRPDPTSSSFKKPVGDMNVASGCPLFASHSVVESPTHLKDDTIYIKVTIDTADLGIP